MMTSDSLVMCLLEDLKGLINSCGSRSNRNQKSVGIVHLLVVEVDVTSIGKLFNCSFGGAGGWLW
ncbi:hypothetical protein Hanom_Chr12g01170071 [Helianthus anomalus]